MLERLHKWFAAAGCIAREDAGGGERWLERLLAARGGSKVAWCSVVVAIGVILLTVVQSIDLEIDKGDCTNSELKLSTISGCEWSSRWLDTGSSTTRD